MKTSQLFRGLFVLFLAAFLLSACGTGPENDQTGDGAGDLGGGTGGSGEGSGGSGDETDGGGIDDSETDEIQTPDEGAGLPQNGGSTSSGNPSADEGSGLPTPFISFNLYGAIGLAIDNSTPSSSTPSTLRAATNDAGSSNLKRVNADNSLSDAVSEGTLTVSSFMVAGGNQVYLLLESPVEACILLRVNGETNEATCVDPELSEVNGANAFGAPIQFDDQGNIYYVGSLSDGSTVLRKNASGETTDLINDYIALKGFIVLEDGTVFLAGTTAPTGAEWVRQILPDTSVETILTLVPEFLALFPDGNLYYGASAGLTRGVGRYLLSTNEIDPQAWISEDGTGAYNDCPVEGSDCGVANLLARTTNGKIYATVEGADGRNNLVQYYSTVELPDITIADVTVSKAILTYLILAGMDEANTQRLMLYETNGGSETDLLGGEEIEVYHVAYLNSTNHQTLMFDGLRFSDGSYVLCQVDLTNGNTLVCSSTGLNRLTDFQLFNAQ